MTDIRKDVSKLSSQMKNICCTLADLAGSGSTANLATEATLVSVLAAINNSNQDLEIILVRDGNGNIIQQITELVTGTVTYKDVNGVVIATPTAPLEYQDASAVLNLILAEMLTLNTTDFATETTLSSLLLSSNLGATEVTLAALLTAFNAEDFATETTLALLEGKDFATESTLSALAATDFATETTLASLLAIDFATETTLALANSNIVLGNITLNSLLTAFNNEDFATETTLADLNTKLNTLGQKASAASAPVVLSTEQEVILNAIKTAVEAIDLDADGLAQEATLTATNVLLTAIDSVLDTIKVDTSNLDVALSTRATEATLLLSKGVLDNIKLDTANLDVALSTRATEATVLATNVLLTTIDGVLDNILLGTTAIAVDTSTLATPVTGLATSLTRVTVAGAATVAAGKRRASFFNAGNSDSTVAGGTLERGETITFSADGLRDTLAAIAYNSLTSELVITTVG
jgi:hypothetical protein